MTRGPLALLLIIVASVTPPSGASAASHREIVDRTIADARATMLVDPRRAWSKAQLAEQYSRRIVDPATRSITQATATWLQGEAASRLKESAVAERKLNASLEIAHRFAPASKIEADILNSLGSLHGSTGQVVTALREFQRAHAIYLSLGDARNRAIVLICIGSLYSNAKDYKTALKYLDEALSVFDGDPGLTLAIQNNRAEVLHSLGRYLDAERGFRTALAMGRTMRSPVLETQILYNIALAQLGGNDVDGADRTIAQAQRIGRQADGFSQQAVLAVAAQAASQHGRMQLAASLIDRSFAGVDLTATPFHFRQAHLTAYQVFDALGQTGKALTHLAALKRLDDQTTKLATSTGAALMAARFDFANQELRIARLKAEDLERRVAAERAQAASERLMFFGGAVATVIVVAALIAGLLAVRRSRDRVRAANADLEVSNDALGKALAAKTEFLATTSHEIRTPLNGILGMTQVMLADTALPPVTRDRLQVVQQAGTTMRALVDDILDVAKMENGRLVLESAPFDLATTILDATRLWEAQAAAKGISFVRALDGCPALVVGDAARVRQVVFNLLSNALKFTEAGEVGISARALDGGGVAIAVRDSGVGIEAGKLEAIFESFRQADAGTTRRFGGTGLGLAICRQLARAMGGDVAVESVLGEGSVFTLTLPLASVDACAEIAAVDVQPALLIVERNPIARSLLRSLLAPHTPRILFASDAGEAVATIGEGCVTRVLVDEATVRGDADPRDSLRRIVAALDGAGEVTLLWPETGDAETAALLGTGIDQILTKPVSGPSLVAMLFHPGNDPLVRRAA